MKQYPVLWSVILIVVVGIGVIFIQEKDITRVFAANPQVQYLTFDGVDDLVNLPDPGIGEGYSALTVMAWAKSDVVTTVDGRGIVARSKGSGGDTFYLSLANSDEIKFSVYTTSGNNVTKANADLADTNWHHYAVVVIATPK